MEEDFDTPRSEAEFSEFKNQRNSSRNDFRKIILKIHEF